MSQLGDDCYFFYNSTCAKGVGCMYRHVEAARGSEVVCNFWQMGNCTRPGCKFRHMEIQSDRSKKACYWENQPSGCTKSHCPFKHFKPRSTSGLSIDEALPSGPLGNLAYKASSRTENVGIRVPLEIDAERASPKIEPVIVNPLEDDSECESVHGTPQKTLSVTRKEAPDISTVAVATTVQHEPEPVETASSAVNSISTKSIRRKIKLLDDGGEKDKEIGLVQEESAATYFTESDTRRNVVIRTQDEDSLGENFEDFMKKRSKNIPSANTIPEKKTSVLKRLGNPKQVESKPSKTNVKKRLGRVEADQGERVKVSILDRLGGSAPRTSSSPERGTVKKRLGLMSASAKLGLKSMDELRTQKLQLQKQLEEAEDSGSDEVDEVDEESLPKSDLPAVIKKGKRNFAALQDPEDEEFLKDIKVKSLAQIRAEKAKKDKSKVERTSPKKGGLPPAKSTKPKRKIMVYTELFEDGTERSPSPEEPEPSVRVKNLEDIKAERAKRKPVAAKKERQIYMPPAIKNGAIKAAVPKPATVAKEEKQESKVKTKPAEKASVKTFSEIMAEKRRKLQEQKAQREAVSAPAALPKSTFTAKPIVFDVKDNASEESSTRDRSKQTINPLRNQASQENVSINSSPKEPQAGAELRLLEDSFLSSKASCESVGDSTKTEQVPVSETINRAHDSGDSVSPPKRRSSSQGSDMPTRKKSRQSLLNEDEDDFFFGDDLDEFEDDGKVDDSDLLQDIDALLA